MSEITSGCNKPIKSSIIWNQKLLRKLPYGSSFYGVLGMDVEDTLQEDSDIEVVSGPYKEYPEEKIEQLNKEAYGE